MFKWIAYVLPIIPVKLIKLIDEFKITYPFLCYDYNSHYHVSFKIQKPNIFTEQYSVGIRLSKNTHRSHKPIINFYNGFPKP